MQRTRRYRVDVVSAVVTVLATATRAHADCPTDITALPPVGLLTSTVPDATSEPTAETTTPGSTVFIPPRPPVFTAHAGVAGGVRADGDKAYGTASLGGETAVHAGGFAACASGDVLDAHEGAARVTGSIAIPLGLTGVSAGAAVDREARLPLSMRPELFRAPVDRVALQISGALIDWTTIEPQVTFRALVFPVTVEQTATKQDDGVQLDRHTFRLDVSLVRALVTDAKGTGELRAFSYDMEAVGASSVRPGVLVAPTESFARASFISFAGATRRRSFELDGGYILRGGLLGCDETTWCSRGYYVGKLRHAWRQIAVEGRAERTAFIATNDVLALEDRVAATASFSGDKRGASASAFLARSEAWVDGTRGSSAGLRVSLSHELKSGVSALVDGELVRTRGNLYGSSSKALPPEAGRVLVSLAWKKRMIRY